MIRILPFIIIPFVLILGLGYWRYIATQPSLTTPKTAQTTNSTQGLVEVPKTLPGATIDDRVKALEDALSKVVLQVNNLVSSNTQNPSNSSLDSRLKTVETAVTDLKLRVSSLEKASPAPAASSSKYPLYIPLGSDGGPWGDQSWNTLTEYQASINGDNYSGYTSMQLEANFRLAEALGTGSVRLYNVTDGVYVTSQIDTTSTSFGLKTSSGFKLPSGQKTYTLQVQSTEGKNLFIQTARIKVNF